MLQRSKDRMLIPPPGLNQDSDLMSSSGDSEDDFGPKLLGVKPKLERKDTFYDVNYEAVKVSNVPKTTEGWLFFMDLLKTEHRKFQFLLTNLRIERAKILKEMEEFSNSFTIAKKYVQEQFTTSMKDLHAVNIDRLLNGEINKRSSSYIKTTNKSQIRNNTKNNHNGGLTSVQESDFDDDNDIGNFGGGSGSDRGGDYSVKLSTPSERRNRPTVPMEHDINEKLQKRNKLRQRSSVKTFNISTQTIDENNPIYGTSRKYRLNNTNNSNTNNTTTGTSRLEKFRNDSLLAEQFQYQARPHALSQPFLGYIRKHEKIYSRELGLMRIALREFKGLYDHLKQRLDIILNLACQGNTAPTVLTSLQQIQLLFHDGSWVFEPKYFIKKIEMNPLEDPVDVASQANIIQSYQQALDENKREIQFSKDNNNFERVELLLQVQNELNNLLIDLNNRVRDKGGWRSLLYTTNGAVDMSMSLTPWKLEEQVEILQEKLRYIQLKSTEREKEHETVIKQLHDTLEEVTLSRQRPSLYVSSKVPPKGTGTGAASATSTGVRSMSMSGPPVPRPHSHSSSSISSTNQAETHHGARTGSGARAHRHTLAYVTATSQGLAPQGIAVPLHAQHPPHHHTTHQPHPELHETSEQNSPHKGSITGPSSMVSSPRTIVPSGSTFIDNDDESLSAPGSPQSPKRKQSQQPPNPIPSLETRKTMSSVLGTLRVLHTTLDSSQRQQEQQHQYIKHLQLQLRQQQQHINELHEQQYSNDHHQDLDVMNGSVDGESSMLSQPSQEIIDEYQQIGVKRNNDVKTTTTSAVQAMRRPSSAAGIMITATGTEEANISSKQRRGSMLVQHRGDAHPLEYVPIGKPITAHNLRITVNNELRGHKHLLLRPNSAAGISQNQQVGPTRSFASIMAAGGNPNPVGIHSSSMGAKAPLSKLQQLETIKRQDKAIQMLHPTGTAPSLFGTHSPTNAGTPTKTSEANYIPLPALHVLPPSPKDKRKMSHTALVKELSTIMDDSLLGTAVGPTLGSDAEISDDQSIQLSSNSAAVEGNHHAEGRSATASKIFQVTVSTEGMSTTKCTTAATTTATTAAKVDFPPPHSHTPPVETLSPEELLQSINTLCEQLQDSLVIHSASLKTGQELLAGMDTTSSTSSMATTSSTSSMADMNTGGKFENSVELYGLKIGESAIEHERSEEKLYQNEGIQRHKQHHHHYDHQQQHSTSSGRRRSSSVDQYEKERPVSSPQPGEGGKTRGFLHTRPKTAYNHTNSTSNDIKHTSSPSIHSYEDMLNEMLNNSSILQKHSDVSIYATTLHNRFIHHAEEMKKLELAMKRLGKASEEDELPQHQHAAYNHYAAINIFRPQSAAAAMNNTNTITTSSSNNNGSIAHTNSINSSYTGQQATQIHTNRSQSASAAVTTNTIRNRAQQQNNMMKKSRGVTTSVPFAKMKKDSVTGSGTGTGSSGILPYSSTSYHSEIDEGGCGSIENNSYFSFSPRLNEQSAELSNLSEHDI